MTNKELPNKKKIMKPKIGKYFESGKNFICIDIHYTQHRVSVLVNNSNERVTQFRTT
jgi:hypothetical protein